MKCIAEEITGAWTQLLRIIPTYDSIDTSEPGDWFDPEVAQEAIDFFDSYLTLTKDAATTKAGE